MPDDSVVWKFVVGVPVEHVALSMLPRSAEVLAVEVEPDGLMVVWAYVRAADRAIEMHERREFVVVNTGDHFDQDLVGRARFIATVRSPSGVVWHVWEREGEPEGARVA